MRIYVRAKPRAKKTAVQKTSENHYTVLVPQEPKEGRANGAIIAALAEYFNLPKSMIVMEAGEMSHNKVFLIVT